ncbi:MAG: SpoIIE family protein phosphatase [Almyronema sp.]
MYSVLIIEDEPINRLILQEAIKQQGYTVFVAQDGAEGIEKAQAVQPALIVCDWMMPNLSGIEVCQWVKSQPALSDAFFILLTARTEIEDRVLGLDSGADDFLAKPIDANELQARVRAGLRLYESNQELRRLNRDVQVQKQRLESELSEAAEYVKSLLPAALNEPIAVHSRFLPSRQLGGDCFDYYWLDDEHFVLYLLDVSGHGLGAALPSVSMQHLLRSQSLPKANLYQPETVLAALNRIFQMDQQNPRFFTLWYGVYHYKTRSLTYASAGHPPALLVGRAGETVQQLGQYGKIPIGVLANSEYSSATCVIEPDTTLYLFSDGIYELQTPDGSLWDLEGFSQLLARLQAEGNCDLDRLVESVRAVQGSATFADDCSIVQVQL